MKLDIFNIDDFVKENHCLPVTNAVALYADGTPTENGLYSEIIFGSTTEEQMNKFAFIDFKGHHFIHPAIYSIIRGRMKTLNDVISGNKYAKLVNKKIVICDEDDPDAGSGLDWFYDIFDKVDWITNDEVNEITSIDKKTRLQLFKSLDKNEFFVNKWLVLPRGYRDYDINSNSMGDDINQIYKKLIQLSKSLESAFGFDLSSNATKFEIQRNICICYDMTLKPITGKSYLTKTNELTGNAKFSMLRKNLVGAHVDFGASSIITAPNVSSAESWDETPAPFGYTQVPLQSIVSMLFPFFIHECGDMLQNICESLEGLIPGVTINQNMFSPSNVQLLLKRFVKSAADRNEPIKFDAVLQNGNEYSIYYNIIETDMKTNESITREFTIMDLIFISAVEICKNKKVLISRYPITTNQSISIFRINVGSTVKTHNVTIKSKLTDGNSSIIEFSHNKYPFIPSDAKKYPEIWTDIVRVLICGNASLASFDGDYDGDMLYCRCLFSNEANAEAEKIINSKANFFSANGDLTRSISGIGKEVILGLYELTRKE